MGSARAQALGAQVTRRPVVVILGMLTKIPVGGPAWLLLHYLEGFRRLGYDPYYVEAHARTPSMFMEHEEDGGSASAAAFIDATLRRFGFGDRWAFHALHEDGRVYGLSEQRLRRLYRSADLIVNLHGGTVPLAEHAESGRLVYLETDPVELEVELHHGLQHARDFVAPHSAFFTWGLNYGNADCRVPLGDLTFHPTPPPVVLDFWRPDGLPPRDAFTTVGNWEQAWRSVELDGELYHWSKHHEFLNILDLPRRVPDAVLELALSSYDEQARALLEEHGWRVVAALPFSRDLDGYRAYVRGSRGELTVAKDQNVRLRSGWFSERSATYLAAGRPVITQETGFSNVLPTGEGLFGFTTVEEAAAAVDAVYSDYDRHARAAREIAHEYFDAQVVVGRMLAQLGLSPKHAKQAIRATVAVGGGRADVGGPAEPDVAPSAREALAVRLAALRREASERGEPSGELGISTAEAYARMIERIRELVAAALPADARVVVVSKGDNELLRLGGRDSAHFPQTEAGVYLGHHPADSGAVIAHLETQRRRGADYLLLPSTSLWWLEYYGDFSDHLDRTGTLVVERADTCRVYALSPEAAARAQQVADTPVADAAPPVLVGGLEERAARLEIGQLLLTLGRPREAALTAWDALDADGDEPRLLVVLARCEEALGDRSAAASLAARAAELAGDDYTSNLELARYAWEHGRLSLAERTLERLVELYPADHVPADDLAAFYSSRLETAALEPALVQRVAERAEALSAGGTASPGALLRLCEAFLALRREREATAMLTAALERSSFEQEPLRAFARRVSRPGAEPSFEDGRALALALTQAGNAHFAAADALRAEACWRLARAAAPGEPAPAFNLAWHALARGDVAAALEQLGAFSRVYPEQSAQIVWPWGDGASWPRARMPLVRSFESLKPRGKPWPRITVITPSFNQAAYLEETLLSVLNQDYPELEYIVVDGGSTDGSVEILRRYEPRLNRLIVEPDRGQSDALNKGLREATGDLVLWVNSDDMLAPGALLMAAVLHLSTDADVLAGFCLEHDARRFAVVNLPAVTQETFSPAHLANLFEYWLKGHYFYQPEVIFTRRMLERVGPSLREDLHYTMDYEFWLRCSGAGARVSVVHWPVGLFRKHPQQKTSALDAAIIEQGTVRDEFQVPAPSFERALSIRTRLNRGLSRPVPRIAVVSTRADKIFASGTAAELADALAADGLDVTFRTDLGVDAARRADLAIVLLHLHREHEALRKVREAGVDVPVIGWAWDNHHHTFENYRCAADVDVLIPGHGFATDYLRSDRYLVEASLSLCVTQWTVREAEELFAEYGLGERRNDLYGGFVRYAFAPKRNRLLEQLRDAGMEGVYFLAEDALESYFGRSPAERFADWAAHKVSLCLPLHGDLSQRFFDALLTGQIPVVAPGIPDLDSVVPPAIQQELPVVRFAEYTVEAVTEAYAEALRRFADEGEAGVRRRHEFARREHLFVPRVRALVARARALAGLEDESA